MNSPWQLTLLLAPLFFTSVSAGVTAYYEGKKQGRCETIAMLPQPEWKALYHSMCIHASDRD